MSLFYKKSVFLKHVMEGACAARPPGGGQHRARRPEEPGPVSSGSCRRTHRTGPQKRQAPAADSHSTVVSSTWFNGGIPFLTANVIMQHGLCSHPKITILLGFILLLPDYILYLK